MKKYKTLLFDADNTLLDFDTTEYKALRTTFALHDIDFTAQMEEDYMAINKVLWDAYEDGLCTREEVIYTRFTKLFQQYAIKEDGIAFEKVYQKQLSMGHDLIDYALELVEKLKIKYDLYIVSNGVSATQYARLQDSGLRTYFKQVFVSEEVKARKPMKAFFDACFAKIGDVDLDSTMIIGDSLSSDMLGGITAGISTCWFNPKHLENKKNLMITYEIADLRELLTILQEDNDNE